MTKSSKDKSKSSSSDPLAMGQAFLRQFEDAGLGPMRWIGTQWLEAMADMNSEVVSFVADRIREDVKTQHALLHCKSAEEAQRIQLDFLEKAYEQYTVETGKLVKMSLDMFPSRGKDIDNSPV